MDVFYGFTWVSGAWLAVQAIPLVAFPTVIIAMLAPEVREPSGTTAGVTSASEDANAPYKEAVLTIATIYHAASSVFCYVSHNTTGRWALMMGSLCSGLLAAAGVWCLLFASSSGKISKTTGADKRTSAFPFQNISSASQQKKAQKNL
ncbi:hypothetical protein DH86_00004105 [Scytalidium sp. 3C]|nr:hypothetical protein DH86_00004105 [Scytalidium sp. 3C]